MPLSSGDKLGPYEIVSAIGAGGMGEVYKARDTRLDRTVAIKVLPDHIAQRDDVRARFEREARSVASLNHPNICSLFDIGRQEEISYMVMELIEGETLAQRIEKGPIPLDQSLKLATQIADALDRAHRAGVTHRDVKPQNIMLTRDGVKVLDFGLAKSVAKPGPTEATLTNVLTTEGTVMGTPQYMAPEQFAGKEADARSDIWAFGAVLYEMATGRKAFHGSNYQSLVGAILATDPAPMAVKPFTPSWLERLVRRCLEKDPEDRFQSMRDVVLELRKPPVDLVAAAPGKAGWWPLAAGILALGFLVSGLLLYKATRPAPLRPLIRMNNEIPAGTPLARVRSAQRVNGHMFALSPDGVRLVVSLRDADGMVRLHTRLLQNTQLTPLPGTENAYGPFFSPDGAWIGFFADGKMKKISVEGGAAVTLCDAPQGFGASWGDDGNIIAALNSGTVLSRIPQNGGTPVAVTKLGRSEMTHRWPYVLPGSQAVLFTSSDRMYADHNDSTIEVISLKTGEQKTLHRGGFSPHYVPGTSGSSVHGHLVYLHLSTLFAAPFDTGSLALAGPAVRILEDVSSTRASGADFAFAANGTSLYLSDKSKIDIFPISWVDRGGKAAQPLHTPSGRYSTPRFSPDGKRLAFSVESGRGSDLWVRDLERDTASRLTFLPGSCTAPVWTPDGKIIVFRATNEIAPGLYAIRSDGSGEARRLAEGDAFAHSISPDGKLLAISKQGKNDLLDIFTIPVEADSGLGTPGIRLGKAVLFLGTPFSEGAPAFSPDGRWLAYHSNESGSSEVYVRPFSASGGRTGGRWQVSVAGGSVPRWSRDGRELLFVGADGRLMAADYTASGESFVVGKPRMWTEVRLMSSSTVPIYDIAPDGKRAAAFVANEGEDKQSLSLNFLMNFGDELRRKAPLN